MPDNGFATKLQYLLHITNTKNATLAKAVQYDLSYISKWLSGKTLPSEKTIDAVIDNIVICLFENGEERLRAEYGCSGDLLKEKLSSELYDEYDKCRPKGNKESFQAVKPISEVVHTIDRKTHDTSNVIAVLDILSMPHESRLILAGIKEGHFSNDLDNVRYSMVISLNSNDCVYDSIFLIHMLTGLSGIDFKLYCNSSAQGKLIYCFDDAVLSAFLFPGSKECVCIGELSEGKKIRQNISSFLEQEKLIFKKTTMQAMIDSKDYFQTLIAPQIKWIIGHPTELLIPQDVFEELIAGEPNSAEFRKLYVLSQSALRNENTQVMIYESTMTNLAIDGTIDFYNKPVKLKAQQVIRCLEYYSELVEMGAEIKLIDGGFSDDFRYITNPCLFLSASTCYLRLENNRYVDNILMLNDRNVKELFERFFNTVWTNRPDVVTSDAVAIHEKMEHYRRSAEALIEA